MKSGFATAFAASAYAPASAKEQDGPLTEVGEGPAPGAPLSLEYPS
jgi:hypothetical protein